MDSKKIRIIAIAGAVVAAVAIGVVAYFLLRDPVEEVVEVTSPWPTADSEHVVPQPEAPPSWPLTGLPAPTAEAPADLRVVSVKIENSPAARPQYGIQSADVVYETITEGGITRFNILFHSTNPAELIGPVRSARLSDRYIVPQYAALFAFSGASGSVNSAIRSKGIENLSQDRGVTYGYKRVSFKSAPHNLFLDLEKIREEGTRRGHSPTQEWRSLAFERSPLSTPTITKVTIPFSQANTAVWTYDQDKDAYLRMNNGNPHTDAMTEAQITATNVVVLWARTVATSKRDVTGSTTYDIELNGSGRATVFRNGQKLDCTWATDGTTPPSFTAEDGTQVRLSPGNTWFQVVSSNVNIAME